MARDEGGQTPMNSSAVLRARGRSAPPVGSTAALQGTSDHQRRRHSVHQRRRAPPDPDEGRRGAATRARLPGRPPVFHRFCKGYSILCRVRCPSGSSFAVSIINNQHGMLNTQGRSGRALPRPRNGGHPAAPPTGRRGNSRGGGGAESPPDMPLCPAAGAIPRASGSAGNPRTGEARRVGCATFCGTRAHATFNSRSESPRTPDVASAQDVPEGRNWELSCAA